MRWPTRSGRAIVEGAPGPRRVRRGGRSGAGSRGAGTQRAPGQAVEGSRGRGARSQGAVGRGRPGAASSDQGSPRGRPPGGEGRTIETGSGGNEDGSAGSVEEGARSRIGGRPGAVRSRSSRAEGVTHPPQIAEKVMRPCHVAEVTQFL